MTRTRVALLLAGVALTAAAPASAYGVFEAPATFVAVAVQVEGRLASLYPAPDGSGRYYLEAWNGSPYSVRLTNRTGERVGVVLTVDGLNAISGERDTGRGRMYVLDPWQSTTVQGWRTSLEEVRRFSFVDERRSYAARSGKANEKMGWIEVAVYRERQAFVRSWPLPYPAPRRPYPIEGPDQGGRTQAPAAPEASSARGDAGAAARPEAEAKLEKDANEARSYPGTGWGERTHDPVVLVSFDPELEPRERVTLRYEYRSALVALGVLPPWKWRDRDRLFERDHAEPGFAQAPRW